MSKCTCNEEDHEPHPCPYNQDVYNEAYLPEEEWILCTCCPECTYQCAMDI